MKTINKVVLALFTSFCLIGVAFAASEAVDRVTSVRPQHFLKGIYVGTDSSRAATDTSNKLTHTGSEKLDYLFPAILNDGGLDGDACILSTNTATVEGAQTGDPCMVGFTLAAVPDAGGDSIFNCFVTSAGRVGVRRCAPRGAGALPDAGYYVRTFSNL